MLESKFKEKFFEEFKAKVPQTGILYKASFSKRSYPDVVLLGPNGRWAVLEFKRAEKAARRIHQALHIEILSEMGYARFVSPENSEEVIRELEAYFA